MRKKKEVGIGGGGGAGWLGQTNCVWEVGDGGKLKLAGCADGWETAIVCVGKGRQDSKGMAATSPLSCPSFHPCTSRPTLGNLGQSRAWAGRGRWAGRGGVG